MKTNNKGIIAFLFAVLFFLTGCANFSGTGQSVWSEGLWILPWITGLGAAFFGYQAYRASKSGSIITNPDGTETPSKKNLPIYEIGQFWFFVGLAIATIFIIWNVVSNK